MSRIIDMSESEERELKKLLDEYRAERRRWKGTLGFDAHISERILSDYMIIEQAVRSEIQRMNELIKKSEQGWKRENDGRQEQRRRGSDHGLCC